MFVPDILLYPVFVPDSLPGFVLVMLRVFTLKVMQRKEDDEKRKGLQGLLSRYEACTFGKVIPKGTNRWSIKVRKF